MPQPVTDVEQLREYIGGVMERAEHHADEVSDIALALVGAIVWKKDPGTPIEVRTYNGQMANVLTVVMSGTKYVFRYEHTNKTIELRVGALSGQLLASFSNTTTGAQVKAVFSGL